MADLFITIVFVSASCIIPVLLTALCRLIFRQLLPKRVFVCIWIILSVRLLIPIQGISQFGYPALVPEIQAGRIAAGIRAEADLAEDSYGSGDGVETQTGTAGSFSGGKGLLNSGYAGDTEKPVRICFMSAVWFCVTCTLLCLILGMYIFSYYRLRYSVPADDDCILQWKHRNDPQDRLRIVRSVTTVTPLACGIIHPRIVLPAFDSTENPESLSLVLYHEKAHIDTHDAAAKMLLLITAAVHWFNPFFWLLYALCIRDFEYAADERVLRQNNEDIRKEYACLLLQPFTGNSVISGIGFLRKGNVKERIRNIMKYRRDIFNPKRKAAGIVLTACAFVFCLWTLWRSEPVSGAEIQIMQEYNRTHTENLFTGDPWIEAEAYSAAAKSDTAMPNAEPAEAIGTLSIPAIHVELPIYDSASANTMQVGIGHLEGTSFPTGGPGTHTVLAGHRGTQEEKLLTDLDKVRIGDSFSILIGEETLQYEVDQIEVCAPLDGSVLYAGGHQADPQDADMQDPLQYLAVVPGEDFVTIITATPYGVNTNRLLVRGHRV